MGGQACVFYGAAQFSRDTDLAIVADAANLGRLRRAFEDLRAQVIAVPPFALSFLRRGHAIHFRCYHPDAMKMRVDIMSSMRGVDAFPKLWKRRTSIETSEGIQIDLLSLPDLVRAKKTQRNKDWPMIQRLVEVLYFENRDDPNPSQIRFCLLELRTPELLVEVAGRFPSACQRLVPSRRLLTYAARGDLKNLAIALFEEETREREKDTRYWLPLRSELEKLRRARLRKQNQNEN